MSEVVKYYVLKNPILDFIEQKAVASNKQIEEHLVVLGFEVGQFNKGKVLQLFYNAAWCRSYLKKCGAIESVGVGLWKIGPNFDQVRQMSDREMVKLAVTKFKTKKLLTKQKTDASFGLPIKQMFDQGIIDSTTALKMMFKVYVA